MIFKIMQCKKCGQLRKFVQDTPREIEQICGNCWDWKKFPNNGFIEYIDDRKNYKPRYPEMSDAALII